MAKMHPEDLNNYDCTSTEREMYYALKEGLSDEKCEVFYSVRWYDKDHDGNRIDSESDFLIFHSSFGFLTIEVKGGTGINVTDGKWLLYQDYATNPRGARYLKESPYLQAEKSMRHFKKYFEEETMQSFLGVYGFAVAFPRYSVNESISHEALPEITIDINDIQNIGIKINSIFHYWKSKRNIITPFSQEQKRQLLKSINKNVSLSAAAGALIPIKEREFEKINLVQDGILDLLFFYKQARIIGGAGTGKTFIAIKKAKRDSKNGKSVLFLSCNDELSNFVSQQLNGLENVKCTTFYNLIKKIYFEHFGTIPNFENSNFCCFDIIQGIDSLEKFDSIIVDEAQDFNVDMALSVKTFLKDENNSELYVFYDKNQNVFLVDNDNPFDISNPEFILRYNIRNTGQIYECAQIRTGLGEDTIANQLLGVSPEINPTYSGSQNRNILTKIVNRLVQKEFVSTRSIAIVSDVRYEDSILSNENRVGAYSISFNDLKDITNHEVCFKTVEQFKGLEADVVIYLRHNVDDNRPQDILFKTKEYIALTRARYFLYILNSKQR